MTKRIANDDLFARLLTDLASALDKRVTMRKWQEEFALNALRDQSVNWFEIAQHSWDEVILALTLWAVDENSERAVSALNRAQTVSHQYYRAMYLDSWADGLVPNPGWHFCDRLFCLFALALVRSAETEVRLLAKMIKSLFDTRDEVGAYSPKPLRLFYFKLSQFVLNESSASIDDHNKELGIYGPLFDASASLETVHAALGVVLEYHFDVRLRGKFRKENGEDSPLRDPDIGHVPLEALAWISAMKNKFPIDSFRGINPLLQDHYFRVPVYEPVDLPIVEIFSKRARELYGGQFSESSSYP
jgi:hypothetical protein